MLQQRAQRPGLGCGVVKPRQFPFGGGEQTLDLGFQRPLRGGERLVLPLGTGLVSKRCADPTFLLVVSAVPTPPSYW